MTVGESTVAAGRRKVLCLDDEPAVRAVVSATLRRSGYDTVEAGTVAEALRGLAAGDVDLVLSDYAMPGMNGIEVLRLLRDEGYAMPVIILTGMATIELAVSAVKAGAADYLAKPFGHEQLQLAVQRAIASEELRRDHEALRRQMVADRFERGVIGESAAMRAILETVSMAAATRATVLLQGESGTGKEVLSRALHDLSDRRDRPFIKLNCAALPEGLIESALFGHEKGAFTGALKRVEGAFERAHGGTLLLDEITEMRLDLQAKLLRVLQEQEFERVGGTHPIRVDVRVIATTNREMAAEVAAGRFRQDLYYRLNVLTLDVPPLRERREDVPLLANRFAIRAAIECGRPTPSFAPESMALLQRYDWPGNVRELQHAVERAVILSTEPELRPHLFQALREGRPGLGRPTPSFGEHAIAVETLPTLNLEALEARAIARALEMTGNNRSRAADLLGINIRTLRRKLNDGDTLGVVDAPAA